MLGRLSWLSALLRGAGLTMLVAMPPSRAVLGAYVTSLADRTEGQRHNAIRAARAVDGRVL